MINHCIFCVYVPLKDQYFFNSPLSVSQSLVDTRFVYWKLKASFSLVSPCYFLLFLFFCWIGLFFFFFFFRKGTFFMKWAAYDSSILALACKVLRVYIYYLILKIPNNIYLLIYVFNDCQRILESSRRNFEIVKLKIYFRILKAYWNLRFLNQRWYNENGVWNLCK